jgi:hypothetical protein
MRSYDKDYVLLNRRELTFVTFSTSAHVDGNFWTLNMLMSLMYTIGCRHENCIFGSVHLDANLTNFEGEHCRCICALYDIWDTTTRIAFS